MASQVCETLAFINGDDEVKGMEVLEINGDFFMSLMEESPCDESDDDRLNSLIRSFEAEISGSKNNNMDGHDSSSSSSYIIGSEFASNNFGEDDQSWNMGQVDGQDYLGSSSDEFKVEWVDMDFMPSSPCDEKSWCVETFGVDNIDGMMGTCYDGFAMEEHGYNSSCYNLVR